MGVKGKKRSSEAPDAPKISAVKQQSQSSPKKQKIESVNTNGSGLLKTKLAKKNKNVQAKQDKPIENVDKSSGANEIAPKPKKKIEKSPSVLAKEKNKKREKRRQNRNKFGQYKPENIFSSVEELEKKISQIKAMEKKSKSARRRLGVLKKKLQIKQGTYVPPAKPLVQKGDKAANADKKKLKKENAVDKKNSNESNGENAVAKVKGAVEAPKNKIKQNNKTGNVKKIEVKSKGKVMPKKVEESEQDDDEDEGDQDSMDASDVEDEDSCDAEEEEEEEGKDDEDEEDNDDEDEEDIDDEDEEDIDDDDDDDDYDDDDDGEKKTGKEDKQSQQKKQKVAQQISKYTNNVAKDDQSAKKTQPEKSDPKKTRYVLFVGNLPYS